MRLIYGYMGFATFLIFFFMTGGILLDFAQTIGVHLDAVSVVLWLLNFACVGPTILFFQPGPLLLKQVWRLCVWNACSLHRCRHAQRAAQGLQFVTHFARCMEHSCLARLQACRLC